MPLYPQRLLDASSPPSARAAWRPGGLLLRPIQARFDTAEVVCHHARATLPPARRGGPLPDCAIAPRWPRPLVPTTRAVNRFLPMAPLCPPTPRGCVPDRPASATERG